MNSVLQLPLAFDTIKLAAELRLCESEQWTPHFNTADYSGTWAIISLRSASGNATDILSHPGDGGYRDTPLLARCRYLAEIVAGFECEKESVRLLSLAPGAHIHEHIDPGAGYQHGLFRIHIPMQTNGDVYFIVDGHRLNMQSGQCWYADFSLPHSVQNRGSQARVNLILDCKRNAWSDRLFERAGYDFDAEARAKRPDASTRAKIVAQLAEMKTDTADRLIQQLLAEAQLDG
jgi:mannose-6-phosphate isomerase-like protein (cupin superfamily)